MANPRNVEASPEEDLLVLNGINGSTGDYLLPQISVEDLSALIQGEDIKQKDPQDMLNERRNRDEEGHLGPQRNVDPLDLASAGWGVIFPATMHERTLIAIKTAIRPLLDWRRQHAAKKKEQRYREFIGNDDGYQPGESIYEWLPRHGVGPGEAANPDIVPYYLLLVGSPEDIPYTFQYHLDVVYAVGRLFFDQLESESFEDVLVKYARYAESVVAVERGQPFLPRRAAFFGVANPDDPATQRSAQELVAPLAQDLEGKMPDWRQTVVLAEGATKDRLGHLLGGNETPALLFTASHGMGFELDDDRLVRHQGALLCQDWPGWKNYKGKIPDTFYFSADSVASDAQVMGMIAFHFACFGAGTPQFDDFRFTPGAQRQIAPRPLVGHLPQKLLSHPKGSALAVLGHVDRAWTYSFTWKQAQKQTGTFADMLSTLMNGEPVGWATEIINARYAALSPGLSELLGKIRLGLIPNHKDLTSIWTATNDARSYVVLGDPAVRLPVVQEDAQPASRPTIGMITLPPTTPPAQVEIGVAVTVANGGGDIQAALSGHAISNEFEAALPEAALDFGALGGLQNARESLVTGLKDLGDRLGTTLQEVVTNLTSVDVATYVSSDMDTVTFDRAGKFTGDVRLRALTRIQLDGDTIVCVPDRTRDIDQALWSIHMDTVEKALTHRAELLKTAVSAASGLLEALKGV